MHELSIAEALISEVETLAECERAVAVRRVVLMLGDLSGVDPEALRTAFPVAAEGSRAAEAELVIEKVSARVRCSVCGHTEPADDYAVICSLCGAVAVEITEGRELLIKSLELSVEERQVENV